MDYGAPGDEGGPPGYDPVDWQRQVIAATPYYKVMYEGQTAGGVFIVDKGGGHYYLARIYLAPEYQGQGIGLAAVRALLALYPNANKWSLDTPAWNTRTRPFYEKLSFQMVGETDEGLLLFEKTVA